ncbi:hypothetical protein [Dokdonella sp.]|uniref:F0F1 ATP synthase subunit B family protein n=1 Tax=Dokdonella sp. TaxID=2291710 RepID=UPI0031C690C7|nr:hypothetical protein [Dokdonella sp.]
MSIDWITVAAQILNFLVLVWLLKRFLYRPILDGIDAREKEIAERMGEAARIRAVAEAAEADYQAQVASLRAGREGTLEAARKAAEAERDALLAEARERLAREQAERAVQRVEEARRYRAELQRDGAAALLSLTRKALKDLADETLEARIVAHASDRLAAMADDLRKAAGDSLQAIALTHEPLSQAARERLGNELAQLIPGITVTFRSEPAQAPGLVLRLGGAQVEWTVDSYIDGLDALLAAADHQRARPRG